MEYRLVLLVDDNPDFLALSQEFINAHEGLEVIGTATSAQEALDILNRITPNLVITDLVMPGVSGLELAQMVKSRWPELAIIVMTMLDTPYHQQAAFSAGADAFVAKATMDADLMPTIWNLLRRTRTSNGNGSSP